MVIKECKKELAIQIFNFYFISQKKIPNCIAPIFDHPYRTLSICGSGSAKTNTLLSFTNDQPDKI